MLCMDGLICLCEWPNAGLWSAGEAGVCWGHDATQVGRNILLVTCQHLQVLTNYLLSCFGGRPTTELCILWKKRRT